MTKEDAYDQFIAPLMEDIIEACKEHKIAMLCDFELGDDGLKCTSSLLDDEYEPGPAILKAYEAVKPQRASAFGITIVTPK